MKLHLVGVVGEILNESHCDSFKYFLVSHYLGESGVHCIFNSDLNQKLCISNCHVYKHDCFYICHNYIICSYNRTLAFPFTISSEHNYILFKVCLLSAL